MLVCRNKEKCDDEMVRTRMLNPKKTGYSKTQLLLLCLTELTLCQLFCDVTSNGALISRALASQGMDTVSNLKVFEILIIIFTDGQIKLQI